MGQNTRYDALLIHPPYLLHDGSYPIFPLPWSLGHVGSTMHIGKYPVGPAWTYFPLGFNTMRNFITLNSDFRLDIKNLSVLRYSLPQPIMAKYEDDTEFDWSVLMDLAEASHLSRTVSAIKSLIATLYAVDLHWVNYAQGAIKTLELIKQCHPSSYTLVGGFSASCFADEIMESFPFIDFLIIGDGCRPLLRLLEELNGAQRFETVPNLCYRRDGRLKYGPREALNDSDIVQEDRELLQSIPTARGCPLECMTCGGSHHALAESGCYAPITAYSVDSILTKLSQAPRDLAKPLRVFLIHDPIVTLGREQWEQLLDEISRMEVNVSFVIEFFLPHTKRDIHRIAEKIPGSCISFSPESMDEEARTFHKGIHYTNDELIMNLKTIAAIDDLTMRVWYLAGLAKDSKAGVDSTVAFIEDLSRRVRNREENPLVYTEMLFIDPGSPAFNDPARFGFTKLYNTFAEHMAGFELPLFKYQLNYQTSLLTRNQLFDLFIYMHDKMNMVYHANGILSDGQFERVKRYNSLLRRYEPKYDAAMAIDDLEAQKSEFATIGVQFRSDLES